MTDRISRRTLLAAAGATLVAGRVGLAAPAGRPSLVIYDSRLAASRRLAEGFAATGCRQFDIALQEAGLWREARAGFGLAAGEPVIGCTRWSDWVSLRGLLVGRGLRVARELRLDAPVVREAGRTATLFAWAMA